VARAGRRGEGEEKKMDYRKRWLLEHPQVVLYLSREDYEYLKMLAERENRSYGSLVAELLRRRREYEAGLAELQKKEEELRNREAALLSEIEKREKQVQEALETAKKLAEQAEKIIEESRRSVSNLMQRVIGLIEKVGSKYYDGWLNDTPSVEFVCADYRLGDFDRDFCERFVKVMNDTINGLIRAGILWVVPKQLRGRRFKIVLQD